MQNVLGIALLLLLAWLLSENRRAFPWRFVALFLVLHFLLALVFLKIPLIRQIFGLLGHGVNAISNASQAATAFVFGYIGGGETPFTVVNKNALVVFAFQILPQIIVLSAIFAVLWHWRVLPKIIRGFAWLLNRTGKISGALGLGAASSVFLGMIEAPMLIRSHLARMSRQELFTLMTCGMATVSGTVMILYSSLLSDLVENPFGHILTASVIGVIAAITVARVMIPSDSTPDEFLPVRSEMAYRSSLDAVIQGAQAGTKILVGVITMLLVSIALVNLIDALLSLLPDVSDSPLSIERLLGWVLTPVAWCMGLNTEQAVVGGGLLGTKIVLTEFTAFVELARLPENALDAESYIVMTYALTGFANFASLGIMIGGLSIMAEERSREIIQLAPRAMLAGALASCLSASVIGLLI